MSAKVREGREGVLTIHQSCEGVGGGVRTVNTDTFFWSQLGFSPPSQQAVHALDRVYSNIRNYTLIFCDWGRQIIVRKRFPKNLENFPKNLENFPKNLEKFSKKF
jgi:hypothetical protein